MNRRMTCLLLCAALLIAAASPAMAGTIAVLRPGDQGTAVEVLQRELQEKGYYEYPQITGYYGAETELAVRLFQQAQSLGRDGVAGKVTLRALFGKALEQEMDGQTLIAFEGSMADTAHEEERHTEESGILQKGTQSEAVLALQQRLVELGYLDRADGEFGSATEAAVRRFQVASSLTVDGQAGPQTLSALHAPEAVTAEAYAAAQPSAGSVGEQIIALAKQFLGCRYVYGAAGPNTFDCSGLTRYVFLRFGVDMPHTSRLQGEMGMRVADLQSLRMGDLVFFDSVAGNGLLYDHVGIYISGGQFIHAASGSAGKVVISSLQSGYYRNTFVCGRRLL